MANSTPDTPDVSETKLAALKMDELRAHARKLGIDGADELHKPELLAKVKDYHYAQAHGGKHRDGSGAGSPTNGRPSASELSSMKLGELRKHARKLGIDGADELHKPELLAKVKDHHATNSGGRGATAAKTNRGGNSTPDTPEVSETKLAALKMDELRSHARKLGIDGADELHKPELLAKVKDHHYAQAHGGKHRPDSGSGSTGGAGGPSPVKEDRGGHSTPDTQEANKTALGTASTDTPQDRPSSPALPSPALPSPALPSPALHSSEVDEAD